MRGTDQRVADETCICETTQFYLRSLISAKFAWKYLLTLETLLIRSEVGSVSARATSTDPCFTPHVLFRPFLDQTLFGCVPFCQIFFTVSDN